MKQLMLNFKITKEENRYALTCMPEGIDDVTLKGFAWGSNPITVMLDFAADVAKDKDIRYWKVLKDV